MFARVYLLIYSTDLSITLKDCNTSMIFFGGSISAPLFYREMLGLFITIPTSNQKGQYNL